MSLMLIFNIVRLYTVTTVTVKISTLFREEHERRMGRPRDG